MTATIQVAAVTSPDQWTLGAGANKVVAVNAPNDDDTTYIYASTFGYKQQYNLTANSIPSGSTITSVKISSRAKVVTSPGAYQGYVVLAGVTVTAPPHTPPGSYTTYEDAVSRPGGGSWAVSDLSSLELGLGRTAAGTTRVTSLWIIVNYTPPPSAMFMMFR
jgi:hypothetical protein